jgi:hypothetical protein
MNNYKELYQIVIQGFIDQGWELYLQNSFMTSLRKWKLAHKTEDIKLMESMINIYLDDEDNPTTVMVRFAYYSKE